MTTIRILAIGLSLLLLGCDKGAKVEDSESRFPDGACSMVGNNPKKHYCVTSAAQLLANPEIYDGKLVGVRGWTTSFDGHAEMYLSREMLDGADAYGSIALMDGPAVSEIIKAVGVSSAENPGRSLLVFGRFFLNRKDGSQRSTLENARYRFGSLHEVEGFRP